MGKRLFKIEEGNLEKITRVVEKEYNEPEKISDKLLQLYNKNGSSIDPDLFRKSVEIACKAHDGQLRYSGEPFVVHPLRVAYITSRFTGNDGAIYVGNLHDSVEDSQDPYSIGWEIYKEMGLNIFLGVMGMTKMNKAESEKTKFEKMHYFSKRYDIDLEPIRVADAIDNLFSIKYLTPEEDVTGEKRQQRYCDMVRDFILPISQYIDTKKTGNIYGYVASLLEKNEKRINA